MQDIFPKQAGMIMYNETMRNEDYQHFFSQRYITISLNVLNISMMARFIAIALTQELMA